MTVPEEKGNNGTKESLASGPSISDEGIARAIRCSEGLHLLFILFLPGTLYSEKKKVFIP